MSGLERKLLNRLTVSSFNNSNINLSKIWANPDDELWDIGPDTYIEKAGIHYFGFNIQGQRVYIDNDVYVSLIEQAKTLGEVQPAEAINNEVYNAGELIRKGNRFYMMVWEDGDIYHIDLNNLTKTMSEILDDMP